MNVIICFGLMYMGLDSLRHEDRPAWGGYFLMAAAVWFV